MKLLLVIVMLYSVKTMACSCSAWENVSQIVDQANGVYVAIPMENSRRVFRRQIPRRPIPRLMKTQMKIVRSYKGSTSETVNVFHDPKIGTSCEFKFEKQDGIFVVITYKVNGRQMTDSCSTSQLGPYNSMATNFLLQL